MQNKKVHNRLPALQMTNFSFFKVLFLEVAEHVLFLEASCKAKEFIIFGRP